MVLSVEKLVDQLSANGDKHIVSDALTGVEKESLRVSPDGSISPLPHPISLGSALTHPYITTDYSEALIEFITPPFVKSADALSFLCDTQKFVYQNLGVETLWATSMPCILEGGANIPLAHYGDSNAGVMKTVYRRGLGHRYGRVMQVIAGVHFNFSFNEALWPLLQSLAGSSQSSRSFVDASYMGLTRNLQRYGWLIPYLFGASPAVCKSFLGGKSTRLESFDQTTYYEPYATSLRMGDIGYTNSKEKGVGIKANYNCLDAYVDTLTHAIETPSAIWEKIGVKVNGQYEQLNSNILQIENEYYSTVRPKQILRDMEKPTLALRKRGVQYVELRSLDVNAYDPLGVSEEQMLFLRAFMLFCLLQVSPPINVQEQREIDQNLGGAAHRGRDPNLNLLRLGREVRLRDWATEVCEAMQPVCTMLDRGDAEQSYTKALTAQMEKIEDPEMTPSARMLNEMRDRSEGFYQFAERMSEQHRKYYAGIELSEEREKEFRQQVQQSLLRQEEIEQSDKVSFDQFLADYFAQR